MIGAEEHVSAIPTPLGHGRSWPRAPRGQSPAAPGRVRSFWRAAVGVELCRVMA